MPWCEACDRFLSPPTVRVDGRCPTCGREVLAGGAGRAAEPSPEREPTSDDDALEDIPWHLKMLAGAVAVYLGYRALPLLEWMARLL